MTPGVVGIDLGTSAVKVVIIDASGDILATAAGTYSLDHPEPGAAETDPAAWWEATQDAIRAAVTQAGSLEIVGIGVDGQMHGLVLADAAGRPVRPAMTWADTRATEQLAAWRALPGTARSRLANPLVPGMLGPMLAWVGQHEPAAIDAAAMAMLPKDWIRGQLAGMAPADAVTDPSDASATLLWDIPGDCWASDLASGLGLPGHLLPAVVDSAQPVGPLRPGVAADLGLPESALVAAGAADTAAALLADDLPVGVTQLTVGTGAQIVQQQTTPDGHADPVTHLYRATQPRRWYEMAAVQNAGLAIDWARQLLGATWDELYQALADADRTAPVFVPYLTGERTPVLNATIRGTWDRLDVAHNRADLLRSTQIGVACAIRHALDSLPGPHPQTVRVAGRGTASPHTRQLLADVLEVAIQPMPSVDASPLGAAQLAADAAGVTLNRAITPAADVVAPGQFASARQADYARYRDTVDRMQSQHSVTKA